MDQQGQPSPGARKKLKFRPKVPPLPPPPLPSVSKHEVAAGDEAAEEAEKLMKRFHANLRREVPKVEKTSKVQVAFGLGATPSTSIQKYGIPKKEKVGSSISSSEMDIDGNDGSLQLPPTSSGKEDEAFPSDSMDALPLKTKKYREPWDFEHTCYPTTLPLRKPYSGDPEILDRIECGDPKEKLDTDENAINPASALGLLEESDDKKMFLLQLPSKLPLMKQSASAKEKERAESAMPSQSKRVSGRCAGLEDLPPGYVGKILVYKSGAVKLKLGDVLYDVSPGTERIFAEDIMAIDTKAKRCCNVGELAKHAVVTPNVNSLLDSLAELGSSKPI